MTQNTIKIDNANAVIRGRPEYPSITDVNVRSGPGTNTSIVLQGPVGMRDLAIVDVAPDNEAISADNGKLFQWFQLRFPDGQMGWVRDDLLEVQGDLTPYGYPVVTAQTFAFHLTRTNVNSDKPQSKPIEQPSVAKKTPTTLPADNMKRVQKAALAITAAFEGEGYGAYNNYDAGIVSYGLMQFTLAAGTLYAVIEKYLARSSSQNAHQLQEYADRIRSADQSLRHDTALKDLLIQASSEPEMQAAQDELAIVNYWDRLVDGFVKPRRFELPLTYALLFDISVNFGVGDGFVRMAEEDLGVPSRSRVTENGVSEEQIIQIVADLRRISHDKQAIRDNLPGLRVRGDFWVDLVKKEDWHLQGDDKGFVYVYGRAVQVREP